MTTATATADKNVTVAPKDQPSKIKGLDEKIIFGKDEPRVPKKGRIIRPRKPATKPKKAAAKRKAKQTLPVIVKAKTPSDLELLAKIELASKMLDGLADYLEHARGLLDDLADELNKS